jgi:alcohol dehydrogenase class IV
VASVLGGFFDIPHGAACGTLLSSVVKKSIDMLREHGPEGEADLVKYARAGAILSGRPYRNLADVSDLCGILVETISSWTERLAMPRLSTYGVTQTDMDRIVDVTDNKENPIAFDREAIRQVLLDRL